MPVEILCEHEHWTGLPLQALAETAATATFERLGLDPAVWEISLLAAGDTRIASLNADFRGKPAPTNVLSWPSEERGVVIAGETPVAPDPADPELGDIALAWETIEREARDMGKPMEDHVMHLIVHGLLHLLGYDHERDADATLMEGLESEILGNLGLPDPYGT
ncbi:rRNA maturation RNase YbeY [Histidinibacterium lentulum]|uniref:Endoribonuclease YbeY n=1 Tax=Histidinibacterium lentulum TaxID=2480588 RepID=A0A3N2R7Y2_9RHOB|nr:rRNA maturation RNase YbeY [Histidinibacterium lentulum]ROU03564.1 rRNA maturation RNase YbeY [Histidinibacterium lentulum]